MDAILFIHHLPIDSGITQRHLMLLKILNPDARIFPVSFYDGRPRPMRTKHQQWKDCDIPVFEWFIRERPRFDRYFLIEWDTFCTIPLKEFYGRAYLKNAVGVSVVKPWSDEKSPWFPNDPPLRNWHWFTHCTAPHIFGFQRGIVPICGSMFSHACLSAMVEIYKSEREFDKIFCECRIGTLACMAGFEPEEIREDAHLFISPKPVTISQSRGIWHPVKK